VGAVGAGAAAGDVTTAGALAGASSAQVAEVEIVNKLSKNNRDALLIDANSPDP